MKAVVVGAAAKLGLTIKGKTFASPVIISEVSKKVKEFCLPEDIYTKCQVFPNAIRFLTVKWDFFPKSLGVFKVSMVAFFLSEGKAFHHLDDI